MSQLPKTPPSAKSKSQARTPDRLTRPVHDPEEDQHFPLPLDGTSSTSFSPSKARAQARQTHQLAVLKSWLASILPDTATGKQSPLTARWEAEYLNLAASKPGVAAHVLKALQDLMFANQSADQRGRLTREAKQEELEMCLRLRASDDGQSLLDQMYESLSSSARQSLDSLAESLVLLGLIPQATSHVPLGSELGSALMQRTVNLQMTSDCLSVLSSLKSELEADVEATRKQLQAVDEEKMVEHAGAERMQAQTAQWNREMKQVSVKIHEYKDRIATLERTRPVGGNDTGIVSIDDVVEMQGRLRRRQEATREIEQRLQAFHGLSPDLAASRQEVRRARTELDQLRAKREEMFGRMAEQ